MLRASLVFVALALLGAPALAANRCVDGKGRVTYQDAPCDGAGSGRPVDTGDAFSTRPSRPTITAGAGVGGVGGADSAYSTFRGSWRGPAQLKFTVAGTQDDPPGVTPMVLEIKPDGEVAGFVGQHGCRVSGLATQFVTPASATLTVTLSECTDARFSGRYQGHLNANSSSKEAKVGLQAIGYRGVQMQIVQVDAVLKR